MRLAVPALGALVAEPLFQLCDSAIVGHLGAAQLAGLGAAGAALATLVNVCIFLAYGTTSAVARRMGAGDLTGAVQQGIDGMWVAVLLGAGIAAVSVPLAGPIVGAFGASPAATGYGVIYLRISAAGVPAMLLVLAGLQSQPKDILEAASTDGARPLAIFRELTLPHLRRYIELGIVLGAIYVVNEFDAVYMMTQGGPGISSANLPFYIYQRAFLGFQVGQAAAMGVVVVVATIIIATFALRLIFKTFSGTEQAA